MTLSSRWSNIITSTSLPTSKASKHINLDPFLFFLERNELVDLLLDPELAPYLPRAKEPFIDMAQAIWSPQGLHFRARCLLATLTNRGACHIWAYERNEWKLLFSPSERIFDFHHFDHQNDQQQSLSNLKTKDHFIALCQNVKEIFFTSICWSPVIINDLTLLACGNAQGKIIFWKINKYQLNNHLSTRDSLNLDGLTFNLKNRIHLMRWHQRGENFYLFVSTLNGEVTLIPLEKYNSTFVQSGPFISLWTEQDSARVDHVLFINQDNDEISIIFTKVQHLVIIILNKDGTIKNTNFFLVGLITGLQLIDNHSLLFCTYRGIIYKFSLLFENPPEQIENLRLQNATCVGLTASRSTHLWFLIIRPLRVQTKIYSELRVLMQDETLLIFNPLKPLWTQMDMLEIIRINSMQMEMIPGIEKLYEIESFEDISIEQLKFYLQLVLIALAHEDLRENETRGSELLDFASKIRLYISIHQANWLRERYSLEWQENADNCTNENLLVSWSLANQVLLQAHSEGFLKTKPISLAGPELCPESCIICDEPITITLTEEAISKALGNCEHNVRRCNFTFRQISTESLLTCTRCPGVACCLDIEFFMLSDFPKCMFCDSVLECDDRIR